MKVKEASENIGLKLSIQKAKIMTQSHNFTANRWGKKTWKQGQTLFSWAPKSLQTVMTAMKLRLAFWKKSYDKPRQCITKQRHQFTDKGPSSQSYGYCTDVRVVP